MRYLSVLFVGLTVFVAAAGASDLVREGRIARGLTEELVVGEPLTLKAGDLEFFAIHTAAETAEVRGGVILLHGRGAHPEWQDVIQPLRVELPKSGWETLSLQLPLAGVDGDAWTYEQLIPEADPRIAAAVEFLRQRKIRNIVLVGHSLGARMGVHYLASGQVPKEVRAMVAVGLHFGPEGSPVDTAGDLAQVKLPLLDIYGSRDLDRVLAGVQARAAAARKAENRAYRQTEVIGADHRFQGMDRTLVARVRAWMEKVVTAAEQQAAEAKTTPAQQP